MQATVLSVQGTYLLQTSKITNNEASVFSSSLLYIHSTYADAGNIQLDNNTQRSWECNAIMLYVTVPWNSKEARRSTPSLCCTVPAPIVHFLYLWVTAIRGCFFHIQAVCMGWGISRLHRLCNPPPEILRFHPPRSPKIPLPGGFCRVEPGFFHWQYGCYAVLL